ncbi:unnamed protein product, partial [marine sediment metagenome]
IIDPFPVVSQMIDPFPVVSQIIDPFPVVSQMIDPEVRDDSKCIFFVDRKPYGLVFYSL